MAPVFLAWPSSRELASPLIREKRWRIRSKVSTLSRECSIAREIWQGFGILVKRRTFTVLVCKTTSNFSYHPKSIWQCQNASLHILYCQLNNTSWLPGTLFSPVLPSTKPEEIMISVERVVSIKLSNPIKREYKPRMFRYCTDPQSLCWSSNLARPLS